MVRNTFKRNLTPAEIAVAVIAIVNTLAWTVLTFIIGGVPYGGKIEGERYFIRDDFLRTGEEFIEVDNSLFVFHYNYTSFSLGLAFIGVAVFIHNWWRRRNTDDRPWS